MAKKEVLIINSDTAAASATAAATAAPWVAGGEADKG